MDKIFAWIVVLGLAGLVMFGFGQECTSNLYTETLLVMWGASLLTLTIANHLSKGVLLDVVHAWERARPAHLWLARVYMFFPIIAGFIFVAEYALA